MNTTSDWIPDFGGLTVAPPTWATKRPVRIALLGDFSGGSLRGRLETGAALAKRKPLDVEFDSLDSALERLNLTLRLPVGTDGAAVEIAIGELESFHPDELYRSVEIFGALASLRKRLNNATTYAAAAAEVQRWADPAMMRASTMAVRTRARGATLAAGARLDDFARLTGRAPSNASADSAVTDLLRSIVGPFIVPAAHPQKDVLVSAVDNALSDAMRAVLHQPDFQNIESLWRGVDFLLRRLETGPRLKVHLLDLSAEEFAADLSSVTDLSESGLYKLLVEQPSQDPDGGYAYLAACYRFDATPPQAELLGRAATVAAHAGASLITAIDTDAFTDRKEPPHRLVRQAFEALRALPEASWLGLIGPRFLLRRPYGKKSDPISSFAFEEFGRDSGLRGMLWGHPALLALCVLGVSGGQLAIGDLPFHYYVDEDGDTIALPCTERLIDTRSASLLRDHGINGIMAHKGEPLVRLSGLEAINGDGLIVTGTTLAKPTPVARIALQAKIDTSDRETTTWVPVARRAADPQARSSDAAPADEEPAQALGAATDAPANESDAQPEARSESADTQASVATEATGGSVDDLDALLADLGAADSPATGDAPPKQEGAAAGEDADMDPDLAALLKSLG
jgi:type VI secretion system protein ImpC